ncbi:hypothetical protein B7C42_08400 [Nocardia cerradoensis]|uniref:Uncharacterized protein n=1 Tax=Nocardia cerradoensis TaxID=85688 RepID=A0A231GSG6_9NOCA|nr:hypothetical protein B7C42_08400 [Nocardia cerradoensis]
MTSSRAPMARPIAPAKDGSMYILVPSLLRVMEVEMMMSRSPAA